MLYNLCRVDRSQHRRVICNGWPRVVWRRGRGGSSLARRCKPSAWFRGVSTWCRPCAIRQLYRKNKKSFKNYSESFYFWSSVEVLISNDFLVSDFSWTSRLKSSTHLCVSYLDAWERVRTLAGDTTWCDRRWWTPRSFLRDTRRSCTRWQLDRSSGRLAGVGCRLLFQIQKRLFFKIPKRLFFKIGIV